jgi:hypothetical protein
LAEIDAKVRAHFGLPVTGATSTAEEVVTQEEKAPRKKAAKE